jgi:uncharacterized membrane protein YdjX (TVP38/TMEM64 family)
MTSAAARILRDRRLWLALAAIALVLALRATGLGAYLSLDALAEHRAALSGFVERNAALAAAAYVGVYVAATAFSLPGALVLTVSGGFLFGPVLGTALTVVAATTGATLVFLFARTIFGDGAMERLGPQAARIAEGIRRDAASYLLVLRLVPLFPFFLVNLVPALVGVRLPVFVLTTLFGIIPGSATYSLAGAGLGDVLDAGGRAELGQVLTPAVLGALLGLAALSLAAIPLRRRFAR